jgi:hypothetical protein
VDRDLERGGGRVGVLLGLVLVLELDQPGAAVALTRLLTALRR